MSVLNFGAQEFGHTFFIFPFLVLISFCRGITRLRGRKKYVGRANMHKQIELIRKKQTLSLGLVVNMTLRVYNLCENNLENRRMVF